MSFEFLATDAAEPAGGAAPVARSPMAGAARRAGAQFEVRDGWSVAVSFGAQADEAQACAESAGWADVSHIGKLEVQAGAADLAAIVERCARGASLELGTATRVGESWWCPMNRERLLVLCPPAETRGLRGRLEEAVAAAPGFASVVDRTSGFAAVVLAGPLSREVIARFCALDLRPRVTPVAGLRPGSVARTPGVVVREDEDRYLMLVGAALGEYLWTVVEDAGRHLGGRPVGVDALRPLEAAAHA